MKCHSRTIDAIILTPDIQKDMYMDGCLRSLINHVDMVSVFKSGVIRDFADARNYAMFQHILKHGASKYILIIDSDERLTSKIYLKDMLKDIDSDGVTMPFMVPQIYLCDNKVMVQKESIARIFKVDLGLWFTGKIHETVMKEFMYRNCSIHHLSPDITYIYHLGYDTDYQIALYKAHRNLVRLMEEQHDFNNLDKILNTIGVFGAFRLQKLLLDYMIDTFKDKGRQKYLRDKSFKIDNNSNFTWGKFNVEC